MTRPLFRLGAWLALALGTATMLAAMAVSSLGALALSGAVAYPVDASVGPLDLSAEIAMPVAVAAPVCQESRPGDDTTRGCFSMFVHADDDPEWQMSSPRRQDADVRPVDAVLYGESTMTTTPGWSPFVAASVLIATLRLLVVGAVFLTVWRILACAHAGEVFGGRTVRHLRVLGWVVVLAALAQPAINHLGSLLQLGYSVEIIGAGPMLQPFSDGVYPGSIQFWQLGLGVLALLLAEVFRHGAALEAEQRLTV